MSVAPSTIRQSKRHRPKWITVFAAAFVAGATAAVGVNSFLDAHLSQRKPQVECEPIFVALRSLPEGAPVTVWDVALKDWPKAMLPASALRAHDSFDGFVLRHAVREGQPLLAVQLVRTDGGGQHRATAAGESFTAPIPAAQQPPSNSTQTDLWAPAESISAKQPGAQPKSAPQATVAATAPAAPKAVTPPATAVVTTKPAASSTDIDPTATAAAPADRKPQAEDKPPTVTAKPEIATPKPVAAETVATTAPVPPPAPEPVMPPARIDTSATAPAPVASAPPAPVAPSPTDVDSPALAATQPAVGEPTPAPDIASMPSVMVAETGARPPQDNPPAGSPSGRYLVVPERIALQADTSFATPRRPQPTTSAPQQRPKQPTARNSTSSRRDASSRSQQQQKQKRSSSTPTASQRTWGSFFPNIAAGVEAMSGQTQRGRSTGDQNPSARR
jgi:hypothetical protein